MTHPQSIDATEIGARLRRAAARGNPALLWPDVSAERRRVAMGAIARSTSDVLANRPSALDGDADAIGLAGYVSGMGPLLGWWIERRQLAASDAVAAILRNHWRHNRDRAASLRRACAAVSGALMSAGIKVVILKGLDTESAYFPAPGTRPASDIDLLVDPARLIAAEKVLWSRGFVPASRAERESSWRQPDTPDLPASLYLVHRNDPWNIDLHHSLDIDAAPGAPVAHLDRGRPMAAIRRWAGATAGYALDQPLLALHLAVHAGHGLHNLTLVRLVELIATIRHDTQAGRLSWSDFIDLAIACQALAYAYPALAFAEQLAPGTVPPDVLAAGARAMPRRAHAVMRRLTPATAQRLERISLAEHFMWTRGAGGWGRQIASDLVPHRSLKRTIRIYRARAWQLFGGGRQIL